MNFLSIVNWRGGKAITTSHTSDEDDSLLEIIPDERRTRKQVAYWLSGDKTSTYKLRREPETICELELHLNGPRTAIWMDNETLVYVSQGEYYPDYQHIKKSLNLVCVFVNPKRYTRIVISGKRDDAIADTAMYWWGLYCPEECNSCIEISQSATFDFGAVKTRHLAALFANNPGRRLELKGLTLNATQSVFLATRNHPIDLSFVLSYGSRNVLVDGGDAFVDALQTRKSHFGLLHFLNHIPMSDLNIERLVQLKLFDKLTLHRWDHPMALLPLAAPVRALDYTIDFDTVLAEDIPTLDIVAQDLTVTIMGHRWWEGMDVIIALFARLENLGHLKHLGLKFNIRESEGLIVNTLNTRAYVDHESDLKKSILRALVKTITTNQNLESLNLDIYAFLQKDNLEDFLDFFYNHKGLRTITVEIFSNGINKSDRPWLIHLLSRNRRIELRGEWMTFVMQQREIDGIHSFNRFYTGFESLKSSSQAYRTTLVGMALTEIASGDYHRSALLMANDTDSLCEFIHSANLPSFSEYAASDETILTMESTDGVPHSNTCETSATCG